MKEMVGIGTSMVSSSVCLSIRATNGFGDFHIFPHSLNRYAMLPSHCLPFAFPTFLISQIPSSSEDMFGIACMVELL